MKQYDIKADYLHGELNEEICMMQPQGCEVRKNKVGKLKTSIYELKQSRRCWYDDVLKVLKKLGFKQSPDDSFLM